MSFEAIGDEIGPKQFWMALGARPLGVVVVSSRWEGQSAGILALSCAHISASPPKLLVSVGRTAGAYEPIVKSGAFAANVLPAGENDLANSFSSSEGLDRRFLADEWDTLKTGAPAFTRASVVFDCEVAETVEDEAALVVIGRVVAIRTRDNAGALIAYQGQYLDYPAS